MAYIDKVDILECPKCGSERLWVHVRIKGKKVIHIGCADCGDEGPTRFKEYEYKYELGWDDETGYYPKDEAVE